MSVIIGGLTNRIQQKGQSTYEIPFNRPHLTGDELTYIAEAHAAGHLSGNGLFTQRCQNLLSKRMESPRVLLTHSCTAALEMAALLADLKPGDEVIMPSFTFVSTANAFALRGAVPVFVDIRPDTLNLDEKLIEKAITPRTKAIVPVHYAGVGCDMGFILNLAKKYSLMVIEDAAHGMWATQLGRELGSIGHLGCLSFHETKNIICGEGGALVINEPRLVERAEIIWQKGTDRNKFSRRQVDKYTWVDLGSSFLPNEVTAAFLWAQLEQGYRITAKRRAIWRIFLKDLPPKKKPGFRFLKFLKAAGTTPTFSTFWQKTLSAVKNSSNTCVRGRFPLFFTMSRFIFRRKARSLAVGVSPPGHGAGGRMHNPLAFACKPSLR